MADIIALILHVDIRFNLPRPLRVGKVILSFLPPSPHHDDQCKLQSELCAISNCLLDHANMPDFPNDHSQRPSYVCT